MSPANPTHSAILDEVIAMGADLARAVHRQAMARAEEPDAPLDKATITYDRIARVIRRTICLARKLNEPVSDPALHRRTARATIIRAVEDNIHRHADPREIDNIYNELNERLDDPALDEDILIRPVADIITEFTRDLGLAAIPGLNDPWVRRTPTDITALRARAAASTAARPRDIRHL